MNSPFPKSSSADGEGRIVVRLLPQGVSGIETFIYQYPLKLVTPVSPSEANKSVLVFLLSYGGGLVGGDKVNLSIDVKPGSRLSLATQGHTKIFKSTSPEIVTRQTMRVNIAAGAAVCLLPDPVQPFKNSVYEQIQIFRLARNSSLCLLDWVTQGRTALGENWSFVKWVGRNEVWTVADDQVARDRLLVRDSVILDSNRAHPELPMLRESMHGVGVTGTLVLRGPLMKSLGEFFLAEFATLPRLGARNWKSDNVEEETDALLSPREKWQAGRRRMEKESKLLWSAANVRGCVVVKFGAPVVEAARLWIGSMLAQEGSISQHFGEQALLCVR
ncbi:UreD urease accessory protein-domain-containing protein [Chaetomidium leptoderma]|uniref:UreD urease accessory protein-domain-containing protein n=1 Tax=Chaetomidium leptoderma TaxID=669021 RepID=A0AAN6VFC8_9PEZI|nr:UreD urease accessory protein-domain-containing protein [Chaetomidium leptoderma]